MNQYFNNNIFILKFNNIIVNNFKFKNLIYKEYI